MTPEAVIQGLIARGYAPHIAAGIAGNFAVESGFDTGINEIAPLVPGSRGGYGLAQWTGPRRRQYEAYAEERGAALDDLDTQLDFLDWELSNTEKRAGEALFGAETAEDAARVFSEKFLRPGIPHLERRVSAAKKFAGMSVPETPPNTLRGQQSAPQGPQNQLSAMQPAMPRANMLDPAAFQVDTRPVNYLKFT